MYDPPLIGTFVNSEKNCDGSPEPKNYWRRGFIQVMKRREDREETIGEREGSFGNVRLGAGFGTTLTGWKVNRPYTKSQQSCLCQIQGPLVWLLMSPMEISPMSSTPLRTSGGSTFPSKAIGKPLQACSPISHHRFSINATEYAKYTLLVYTSDIQNPTGIDQEPPNINKVPSRVDYHSLVDFLFVQPGGIPLLPFQRRLHAAPHYRVTRRTRWAKSKPTSPKIRNESPTMSVPPISPSHDTSSRTDGDIDKFQAVVEGAGAVQRRMRRRAVAYHMRRPSGHGRSAQVSYPLREDVPLSEQSFRKEEQPLRPGPDDSFFKPSLQSRSRLMFMALEMDKILYHRHRDD
ncbi:hypothetical protein EDD85DRAFT_989466 [Armillaria nabsnona]|nr:hypothetical protein EDD85DRAFT_989466 [Armillaria nabsnona]